MLTLRKIQMGVICLLLVPVSLVAAEPEAEKSGWSGKGEFGLVATSGNTDTRSIKLLLEFVYEVEKWRHRLGAGVLNAEDNGLTTAKRFDLGAQTDYKFSEKSYLLGVVRYEQDDFSAFEDQTTIAVGYGRHVLNNKKHKLKLEGGVGYRLASVAATGESKNQAVLRGLLDWSWQITPSTSLGDRFLIEAGQNNTFMQNDLGLVVDINSRFALGVGFQVRNNSDAQPGKKKTDTLTSANLVYHFQ